MDKTLNWDDLQHMADNERIVRHAYSLERDREDNQYVLGRKGSLWNVYYYERGEIINEHLFGTEDEACTFLFNQLKKDYTTREK